MGFLQPLKRTKRRKESQTFAAQVVAGARFLPLLAAIIAPLSVLLELAGTTEPWFISSTNGTDIQDARGSLVLSGISFAFNVFGNVLLGLRFTTQTKYWRKAMTASVICWVVKVIMSVINISYYGTLSHTGDAQFSEGFWCAVWSCILAGLIAIALTTHFILRGNKPSTSGESIRVAGARFQMSVVVFLSILAIQAVIFSQIESWTFSQGIYFSLVTAFTIGFGDFEPTYNATRVLEFPFAVATISLLAVMLGQFVGFIGARAAQRKREYRDIYVEELEQRREAEKDVIKRHSLVVEIHEIQTLFQDRRNEKLDQAMDMATSTIAFLVFWFVGASVFMHVEGWAFGTSMYFCYVFFLTIGYGDFSPSSAFGRIFFIVFAFASVPVVTNFVLSTVSGTISALADRVGEKAREKRAPEESEEVLYHSHAYNVLAMSKRLKNLIRTKADEKNEEEAVEAAKLVVQLALRLEAQARALLVETLDDGSQAQVLLRADSSLQRRNAREFREKLGAHKPNREEKLACALAQATAIQADKADMETSDNYTHVEDVFCSEDRLESVRQYRQTFAALLASSSRFLELEGDNQLLFERRRKDEEEADFGGLLLGATRKGPAEKRMGLDV